MTRVDFYLLNDRKSGNREQFSCRLAEKAFRLGHRIFLHTDQTDTARRLDEMLWTFRDISFVPHALAENSGDSERAPVLLGSGQEPEGEFDLLINLDHEVPVFFSRFERVAELVGPDEDSRAKARERYRFYRDRGYPMETHEL